MPAGQRFYTPADVGEVLNVSVRQVRALLQSGDLRGIQVGGRNEWRIEHDELEGYIQRQYERAARFVREGAASGAGTHDGDRVEDEHPSAT